MRREQHNPMGRFISSCIVGNTHYCLNRGEDSETYSSHGTLCHCVHRHRRCKISGFHGGDYEEWRLLGCYAVWLL
jgi:hypothetical protein